VDAHGGTGLLCLLPCLNEIARLARELSKHPAANHLELRDVVQLVVKREVLLFRLRDLFRERILRLPDSILPPGQWEVKGAGKMTVDDDVAPQSAPAVR
jgi:hypothetical protein